MLAAALSWRSLRKDLPLRRLRYREVSSLALHCVAARKVQRLSEFEFIVDSLPAGEQFIGLLIDAGESAAPSVDGSLSRQGIGHNVFAQLLAPPKAERRVLYLRLEFYWARFAALRLESISPPRLRDLTGSASTIDRRETPFA